VQSRFSFLSRFLVKFIEVAGAGLASAVCAYFLGQIGERPLPPPPIVHVSPANDDTIRMARDDHALLAELVRKEAENQKKPENAAAAPTTVSAPKLAKPAPAAQPRRNQKPEQAALGEAKPRATEPLPIQPPMAASNSTAKAAGQNAEPPLGREAPAASGSAGGEEERPLLARLKQVPSWFLPENDRLFGDLPRPPMPVGEFLRSAM
jgi:hypothetical protein